MKPGDSVMYQGQRQRVQNVRTRTYRDQVMVDRHNRRYGWESKLGDQYTQVRLQLGRTQTWVDLRRCREVAA